MTSLMVFQVLWFYLRNHLIFPNWWQVLGDVIESLAGAILVDSGYNKEVVFQSMRPLLEPLITPETVVFHPAKELNELCQKEHFDLKKPIKSTNQGVASITIEVDADGILFKHTARVADKRIAKKLASKGVLESLKKHISKKWTLEVSLSRSFCFLMVKKWKNEL